MSVLIGLMSGTSADGMDAALITTQPHLQLIDALCIPYSADLQNQLRSFALLEAVPAIALLELERQLAEISVQAVNSLLQRNQLKASDIAAIGSHGHTLRHRAQPHGITWQINDPAWIAEHTGITCIADFRRRDIAAGGHGAPLVPAFHAAQLPANSMVLNIGGIANISILPSATQTLLGFDTGPGNALMDEWCQRYFNCACDKGGQLAAQGQVQESLLTSWLAHPYFQQQPPKSTGRELFSLEQLGDLSGYTSLDVLTTLTEFTARSIAIAVEKFGHARGAIYICGGGVHNDYLLARLAALLPAHQIQSSAAQGIDPDWMEAIAFAWLAWRTLEGKSSNAPAVTGAKGERILGGIYPA